MTDHSSIGEIIRGEKDNWEEAYHPIIYLGEINERDIGLSREDFFIGGMMSHSSNWGNIKLKDEHFEVKIDDNPKASYFAKSYLLKRQEWGDFKPVGKLSQKGISFVQSKLKRTQPRLWDKFKDDNR